MFLELYTLISNTLYTLETEMQGGRLSL